MQKSFRVNSQNALVIGEKAESAHGSIVIGKEAKDYDTDPAKAGSGIFIGEKAKSFGGTSQVVLGHYGQVKEQGSTAIGNRTEAIDFQSLAVGESAKPWEIQHLLLVPVVLQNLISLRPLELMLMDEVISLCPWEELMLPLGITLCPLDIKAMPIMDI